MHIKFWSENPNGRQHSEDMFVCEKLTLEWVLGKEDRNCGLGACDSG
jgi:hypothetical protein